MANGFKNFQPSILHGPLYTKDYDTDGMLWMPGSMFSVVSGTWTWTRAAAGKYSLVRTAASASHFLTLDLAQVIQKFGNDPIFSQPGMIKGTLPTPGGTAAASGTYTTKVSDSFEGHILRGLALTSIDVVYNLGTADLAVAHTVSLQQNLYTNGGTAGGAVTQKLAATSAGLVHATTDAIVNIPCTGYVLGNNAVDTADYLELNVNDTGGGTAAYALYGMVLYFDYCLL